MDNKGVEPLAMQIFAGIVLLVIGLGIGYAVYSWAGKGASSMLSFNVTLDTQSITIGRPVGEENSTTVNMTVASFGGTYDKTVSLSATGQPTGVTVSFSPTSGKPEFSSIITVHVDNTAALGTSAITIRGTSDDSTEKTAALTLTVS